MNWGIEFYALEPRNALLSHTCLHIYLYAHSPSSWNKPTNWKNKCLWKLNHSTNICIPWDAYEKEYITATLQCLFPIFFSIYFTCSGGNCILFSLHIRISLFFFCRLFFPIRVLEEEGSGMEINVIYGKKTWEKNDSRRNLQKNF